jgi:hypothetical protein
MFNSDVTLKTENLTSYGMDIHFSLSADSIVHIYCADWLACSLDKNLLASSTYESVLSVST